MIQKFIKSVTLIALLSFIASSCTNERDYTIIQKSLIISNPNLAEYTYRTSNHFDGPIDFVDSANRYVIGDDIRKYILNNSK